MDLVEKAKKNEARKYMKHSTAINFRLKEDDEVEKAKYERTNLNHLGPDVPEEELIFKKLIPMNEKVSNEILSVTPGIRRATLRNI